MKIICFVSIFVLVNGFPLSTNHGFSMPNSNDDYDNEYNGDSDEKSSLSYVKLGSGVNIAWQIEDTYLLVSLKLSNINNWMVLGFHDVDNKEINELKQAMFFRVRRDKLSVKSADWTTEQGFVASEQAIWRKARESETESAFTVIATRRLLGLDLKSPLRMVYSYGKETKFQDINVSFKNSIKYKDVILSKPGEFLERNQTVDQEGPDSSLTVDPNTQSTKSSMMILVSTVQPTVNIGKKATIVKTQDSTSVKTKAVTTPAIHTDAKTSTKISPTHQIKPKISSQTAVLKSTGKPCPITCNCTKNFTQPQRDSHWYDVIRAKENSTYFAIIGASALLTGIIVLCVACCCARNTERPPRSRKHKVAFYKVDDFDSAEDEEIDLINSDKEQM